MTKLTVPDAVNEAGDAVRMRTIALLDFGDVMKILRKGGKCARKDWPRRLVVFFDSARNRIYSINEIQGVQAWVWSPMPNDLTATDWIEVIT